MQWQRNTMNSITSIQHFIIFFYSNSYSTTRWNSTYSNSPTTILATFRSTKSSNGLFENAVDSPINLRGALHDLPKNPKKFCPRFIYGETQTVEDHVKIFKEIFNWKQIANEDVVLYLFPYYLGEIVFNWYINFPPWCIGDWDTFKKKILE